MKARRFAGILLIFILLCASAYKAFESGWFRFNYPDEHRYPIRGIDVSHHQGKIDWEAVRQEGIRFAYIKATEGGDFVDSRFEENWDNARKAGLATGAYHFFSLCRDGASQARNFLAVVPHAEDALPPVVDLELGGNCAVLPAAEKFHGELAVFLEALRRNYGREPVLYVTREFFDAYLSPDLSPDFFPAQPLWVRDIFFTPRWTGGRKWILWQYANHGRMDGIDKAVDFNVFQGDSTEWTAFRL